MRCLGQPLPSYDTGEDFPREALNQKVAPHQGNLEVAPAVEHMFPYGKIDGMRVVREEGYRHVYWRTDETEEVPGEDYTSLCWGSAHPVEVPAETHMFSGPRTDEMGVVLEAGDIYHRLETAELVASQAEEHMSCLT